VEFEELLPRRRMVRHYAPEPVAREVVERWAVADESDRTVDSSAD